MREYVNHKHYFLGPPKTTFQPHSAPETVPRGQEKDDEDAVSEAGLTSSNNASSQPSYFCSSSAPEHAQISTKEAVLAEPRPPVSSELEASVDRATSSLSKASKSKCESPEGINFNTDNASGATASAAASTATVEVRPLHRS